MSFLKDSTVDESQNFISATLIYLWIRFSTSISKGLYVLYLWFDVNAEPLHHLSISVENLHYFSYFPIVLLRALYTRFSNEFMVLGKIPRVPNC